MKRSQHIPTKEFAAIVEQALTADAARSKQALNTLKTYRYNLPEVFARLILQRLYKDPELCNCRQPDAIMRLLNLASFSKTAGKYKDFIIDTTLRGLQHPNGAVRENARKTVDNWPIMFTLGSIEDGEKKFVEQLHELERLITQYEPDKVPAVLQGLAPSVYKTLALTWHDMMAKYRLYEKLDYLQRMMDLGIPDLFEIPNYDEDELDELEDENGEVHIPACYFNSMQPYLSKPIPAIKLAYFSARDTAGRAKLARENDMQCHQCGRAVAVVGSTNVYTGIIICDTCAIGNYQESEGFETRAAAKAHRRRLFDTGYLLTEMVIDRYITRFGIEEPDLTEYERESIMNHSYDLQNSVPKSQKIKLQNTANQSEIEQYYQELIDRHLILPSARL
jgi:hypothetical protein